MSHRIRTVPLLSLGLAVLTLALSGCAGTFGQQVRSKLADLSGNHNSAAGNGQAAAGRPQPKKSLTMELAQGRNLENSNQLDKATEVYHEMRKMYPDRHEPYHRLGVVADKQRRHSEAQRWFTEALQIEPRNAELLNDLGYCFFLQGKMMKAESALLKATQLDPNSERYHNNLGMVMGHQGRHQEALAEFRAAGGEANAFYNLAFVYASQDDAQQAKQCFHRALALDPTHERARKSLRSFEQFDEDDTEDGHEELAYDGNVHYVPYVEGGDEAKQAAGDTAVASSEDASPVRAASHQSDVTMPRRATRSLLDRSRGLLERNRSNLRNETAQPQLIPTPTE